MILSGAQGISDLEHLCLQNCARNSSATGVQLLVTDGCPSCDANQLNIPAPVFLQYFGSSLSLGRVNITFQQVKHYSELILPSAKCPAYSIRSHVPGDIGLCGRWLVHNLHDCSDSALLAINPHVHVAKNSFNCGNASCRLCLLAGGLQPSRKHSSQDNTIQCQ